MSRTGTCERCGEGFVDASYAGLKRFCSDNCKKRAHEAADRVPCPECGKLLTPGSRYPSKRPDLCGECRRREQHANSIGYELERLWAQGLTGREISDRFGWDYERGGRSMVGVYRAKGFNLPHRNRGVENYVRAQRARRERERQAA